MPVARGNSMPMKIPEANKSRRKRKCSMRGRERKGESRRKKKAVNKRVKNIRLTSVDKNREYADRGSLRRLATNMLPAAMPAMKAVMSRAIS